MKNLISLSEAAKHLGICRCTLYRWTKIRRIPYVQLGRRKLFDPSDLEIFVNEHKINIIKNNEV